MGDKSVLPWLITTSRYRASGIATISLTTSGLLCMGSAIVLNTKHLEVIGNKASLTINATS